MLGSAEFYEILKMFEIEFKHMRLDREAKEYWTKGNVYQNGETNNLFRAYQRGIAFGKAFYRD